jgi:predicted MFS family arabinose efflux permease
LTSQKTPSSLGVTKGRFFCHPVTVTLCKKHLLVVSLHLIPLTAGAATGTFFIAFDLGIGLGTIVWGYVVAFTSFQIMYFTSLIPVILAGALFNGLKTRGYFSPREELPAKI